MKSNKITERDRLLLKVAHLKTQRDTATANMAAISLNQSTSELNALLDRFGRKYKLGEKDGIDPDTGRINRVDSPPEAPPPKEGPDVSDPEVRNACRD